jgi:NitT/TauT family transport system permease protein
MKRFLIALNDKLMGFYLLIAMLVLWQVAASAGWVNASYIPAITTIAHEGAVLGVGVVLNHILSSLRRVAVGFVFCAAAGLPAAFILGGAIPKASTVLNALLQFLSQIPPYIIFSVILLLFGPGEISIEFVVFWSGFWPTLFTIIQGVQDIDSMLIRAAKSMKANPVFLFFKVVVPAVLPNIMRGIRLGMTNCFLILIAAETMGATDGIGWLISNGVRMGKVNRVFLGAFLVAIVGFALNYAMQVLEANTTKWKRLSEEALG